MSTQILEERVISKFVWDDDDLEHIKPEDIKEAQSEQHTGMMIAFFLDAENAAKLAIPGGEPAEQLHITLTFMGDSSDFSPQDIDNLKSILAHFAYNHNSLQGSTSGIGRFAASDSSDGMSPIIALVNVPGIQELRADLVKTLHASDFTVDGTWSYTPHITLIYVPSDVQMPIETIPQLSFRLREICLAVGDKHYYYQLDTSEESELAEYNSNHDPSNGEFSSGGGSAASGSSALSIDREAFQHAPLQRFGESTYETSKVNVNGQDYFAKKIPADDVAAQREIVGRQLAVDGGLADRTLPAAMIERNGENYLVQPWVSNGKPLCDVEDAKVSRLLDSMSSEDLTRMQLHEYLLQDYDRHAGNYMVDKSAGKLMEMDMGLTGINEKDNADIMDPVSELYGFKSHKSLDTNSVLTSHLLSRDASLSPKALRDYSKQLKTMEQHIVESKAYTQHGVSLFKQRMQVIRALAKTKNPTIHDLNALSNKD